MEQVISVELERNLTELEIKVLSIVNELYHGKNSIIDGEEIKKRLKQYYEIDMSLSDINDVIMGIQDIESLKRYNHDFFLMEGKNQVLLQIGAEVGLNGKEEIVLLNYRIYSKPYFYVLPKDINYPNNEILKSLESLDKELGLLD
ncbi:hypothetical protein [Staphylococcus pettenkoferi]|uniref:Uncharacterized protein n=1 Tax=Staphylococcus pettenkoferi TaxID=170573 RepID=A0A9Q4D7B1_9STAP|nr:hypothetical protein [Staphylococcus pettenkoferi]MCI2802342.1 hypothetical protein [Staphylococcus pettenkoferi]MCY1595444.1 hypothetical protein [Staphylococcus pettenkoferi]MCY1596608.1 hypothetical protein [Staphylococcus pettenkoferi]